MRKLIYFTAFIFLLTLQTHGQQQVSTKNLQVNTIQHLSLRPIQINDSVLFNSNVRVKGTLYYGTLYPPVSGGGDTITAIKVKCDTVKFPDGTYMMSADGRGVINVNHANYHMLDIDRVVSDSAVGINDTIFLPANPTPEWQRSIIQTNGGAFYSIVAGNGKRIHLNWQYYKVSSTNPTTLIYNQVRDKYEFLSNRIDAMGVDTNSLPMQDMSLYLNADSASVTKGVYVADNGVVPLLPDLTGNGFDAVQSTVAYEPVLHKNIDFGTGTTTHSVVTFDGSNDYFEILNGLILAPNTIVSVVWKGTTSISTLELLNDSLSAYAEMASIYQGAAFICNARATYQYTVTNDVSQYHILTMCIGQSGVNDFIVYLNGEFLNTDASQMTTSIPKNTIGTDVNPFGLPYGQQSIAAIVIAHSSNILLTRLRIDRYLCNLYNIH
jgi:hypothetical protein